MDQSVSFRLAGVQRVFQSVEDEVGLHRASDAPAYDAPGKNVDHEGHVHHVRSRR